MAGSVRHGNPTEVPSPTAGSHATPRDWVLARTVPAGGVAGQGLYKLSGTDWDEGWAWTPPVAAGSVSTAYAPDASAGGPLRDLTVTSAALAVAVPTNPVNRQQLELLFFAQVATTVTFNAGYKLATGINSRAIAIPINQALWALVKYSSLLGAWTLLSTPVTS